METLREDDVGTASELALVARSRRLDGSTPNALQHIADAPTVVWRAPRGSIAAAGATASISAAGPDRFETVRETATALFESLQSEGPRSARPRLFGGFAFHDGAGTDTAWTGFPDAWFVLPRVQVTTRDGTTWLTVTAETADLAAERLDTWSDRLTDATDRERTGPPGIVDKRQTPSREDWHEQITAALDDIRSGRLRKVVLAQSLSVDLTEAVSVPDALVRLDETYPDCYRFAFAPGDGAGTFFGATPETLVSLTDRTLRTGALAGSIGRGETRDEDRWLAEQLRDSDKDNHEHELVVEAIREQLDPVAERVTTGERSIRKLATVQHLETPIRAALDGDRHVLELVDALHPTPAVGGLPPDAALETIKSTEAFDRGWYAAPVGWIDADGGGTFAVAIRSALARERTATLFAGAGIVADSDPDREWDEVQLKYRPMLDQLE